MYRGITKHLFRGLLIFLRKRGPIMNRDGFREIGAFVETNGLGPPAVRGARVSRTLDPATSSPWRPVSRLRSASSLVALHICSHGPRNHDFKRLLNDVRGSSKVPRSFVILARVINRQPHSKFNISRPRSFNPAGFRVIVQSWPSEKFPSNDA